MKKHLYYLPKLGESWGLILIFIVLSLICSFPTEPLKKSVGDIALAILNILTYALLFLYISLRSQNILKQYSAAGLEPPYPKQRRTFNILIALVLIPATICLSLSIEPLYSWWQTPEWFTKIMEEMVSNMDFFASFLMVAVCAPLFEELLCRGVILRGLLQYMAPWKAIVWSAFIFAVMHMNPWQGIPAFLIGLALGWVYYRTRNIWYCVLIHFVNNFTSLMMVRLYPETKEIDSLRKLFTLNEYIIVYIAAVAIVVLSIVYIHKITKNNDSKTEAISPEV